MSPVLHAKRAHFAPASQVVCRTSSDRIRLLRPPHNSPLCSVFIALLLLPLAAYAAEGDTFFRERVEPILKKRCFECHSHADKIKGGLVLDSRSGWQAGGDSGPAIVPGSPEKSRLIEAVRYTNPDMEMPPMAKLPQDEVAALEEWVRRGAPDPRETLAAIKTV